MSRSLYASAQSIIRKVEKTTRNLECGRPTVRDPIWGEIYKMSLTALEWGLRALKIPNQNNKKNDLIHKESDRPEELLNFTLFPITNAAAEGFNSKIQSLKADARGFRNALNYRTRILFYCGRLDLFPSTHEIP